MPGRDDSGAPAPLPPAASPSGRTATNLPVLFRAGCEQGKEEALGGIPGSWTSHPPPHSVLCPGLAGNQEVALFTLPKVAKFKFVPQPTMTQ